MAAIENHQPESVPTESLKPVELWNQRFSSALKRLQLLTRQELIAEEQLIWVAELTWYPIEAVVEELERLVRVDEKHLLPKLYDVQGALEKRFVAATVHVPDCPSCQGDGFRSIQREERGRMVSRVVPCGCARRVMVDTGKTAMHIDGEGIARLPRSEEDRIARSVMGQLGAPGTVKQLPTPNLADRRKELQAQKVKLCRE